MQTLEFETRIPKYFCPFLVEYSVERSINNGKPVIESITYDELPVDVANIAAGVKNWLEDAAANNYSTVCRDNFDKHFKLLSERDNVLGQEAKRLIDAGGVSDEKAREIIVQMQKQMRENHEGTCKMIGEKLAAYFEEAVL